MGNRNSWSSEDDESWHDGPFFLPVAGECNFPAKGVASVVTMQRKKEGKEGRKSGW